MGALAKCGTTVIVTVNSFFGLLGLVFLVSGMFVKYKPDLIDKLSQKAMDKIADEVPSEAGIDLKDLKMSDLVGDASTPMIVLGVVLLAIVVWAYCGTCCKSRWMLVVYACILTAVILGEVVLAILLTSKREKIDDAIKKPLKKSLTKYYTGEKGKDIVTLGWNSLMGLLHCCGVEGASDFNHTEMWNKTYSRTSSGQEVKVVVEAPLLCCKDKSATCSDVTTSNHEYNKGCYEALWDLMKKQKSTAIGVVSGIGVLEVLLWVFVVAIIHDLGKGNKVGPE